MVVVVETEECAARDGRVGAAAGWPCGVQRMLPACVFLGKEGTDERNPPRALAGALGCCENPKEIKAFNI